MRFEEFLSWHQKLIEKRLRAKPDEVDETVFLENIEVAIDAYAEIHDRLRFEAKRWNDRTQQLCQLRDQIRKQKGEANEVS